MAQTYKPGEMVPRDTRDRVKAGTTSLHVTIGVITIQGVAPGSTSTSR
jgi:hypothetical protein